MSAEESVHQFHDTTQPNESKDKTAHANETMGEMYTSRVMYS